LISRGTKVPLSARRGQAYRDFPFRNYIRVRVRVLFSTESIAIGAAGLLPCRTHDVDNLWVVDSACFPSSAALNPALTIAANALRVAATSALVR